MKGKLYKITNNINSKIYIGKKLGNVNKGGKIGSACKDQTKSAYGFKWKYL